MVTETKEDARGASSTTGEGVAATEPTAARAATTEYFIFEIGSKRKLQENYATSVWVSSECKK